MGGLEVAAGERPLIGAIRWDAWHGDLGGAGRVVQRTLQPEKYHFRLPWFARVREDGTVEIRCDRPGIMEQEIRYAVRAGLDYWAFVTYPESNALSIPIQQYLASPQRSRLQFCNIVEWGRFGGPGHYAPMVDRLVGYFRESCYVRVCGGRPLFYLLAHSREHVTKAWGSVAGFGTVVRALRAASLKAGAGDPYVVVMTFRPAECNEIRTDIGADALSSYALPGGTVAGEPFAVSRSRSRDLWRRMGKLGPTIPLVSWGWDARPRVDHPVPWYKPGPEHYETCTPAECALALQDALVWLASHREQCPANTIIAYAWNEHDEGGWLCPTWRADGHPDTRRVEAVGAMLRKQFPPVVPAAEK